MCDIYFEGRTTTSSKHYKQLKQKNKSYFRIIINNRKTDACHKASEYSMTFVYLMYNVN
jgi:uncharacterized protein YukJ